MDLKATLLVLRVFLVHKENINCDVKGVEWVLVRDLSELGLNFIVFGNQQGVSLEFR